MRKFSLFLAVMLLISGMAYAEMGASGYTSNPRYEEQQVFTVVYNNSGAAITSNAVVVIDTTAANVASGSTLGARIATTTTAGNDRAIGVTDQVISDQSYGRVCVRGPHKVWFTTTQGAAAVGNTISTSTTAARVANVPADSTSAVIGVLLSGTQTQDNSVQGLRAEDGEPANLYWAWIRR